MEVSLLRSKRKLEVEIEALRRDLERSKADVAHSAKELEQSLSKEKARDKLIQSGLEYWKAEYDFQKHLMTVGLAAAAGFIALLGGFFGGAAPWAICVVFDRIGISNPAWIGNIFASLVIVGIFCGFLASVISAPRAARSAKSMICDVHRIQVEDDIHKKAPSNATNFRRYSAWSSRSLVMALIAFLGFFVIDMALNWFRGAACM